MKVILPKLNDSSLIHASDIESGKVYRFGHFFACEAIHNNGVIVIDSSDNDVMCFDSSCEFAEWLSDNDSPIHGELTPYEMQIALK
ncbi:hypothetical protein BN79_174 [Yersinia phage phiR2-01]|uniref:Uncharacterized protein n=1 Tax=Yersinia phage phiR2-01 TaxID=1206557 RepID=A0A140KXY7_9CAUD|nr:hypothetical protein BN79_166 [Yersinia phage phiR2-01]YP_009237920.1 hypothetical protein BN79_174 [Yersinia phage phiR2-01]CZT05352.1 hypothetical protein BN79_166 [Yersinia phage phiR2-01]CZT05370.1 hypothetical protein BN79_174 [Yersinia phage phiR2-01]